VYVYVFELLQRVAAAMPLDHLAFEIVLFAMRQVIAMICAGVLFRLVETPLSIWGHKRLPRLCLVERGSAASLPIGSS